MMNLIERVSDRLLGLVAPKAQADAAACDYLPCTKKFCYCGGNRWYQKLCCRNESGSHCCNPCRFAGMSCPY